MRRRANKIGENDLEFLENVGFLANGSLRLLVDLSESIERGGDIEQQLMTVLEVAKRLQKIRSNSLGKIDELRYRGNE